MRVRMEGVIRRHTMCPPRAERTDMSGPAPVFLAALLLHAPPPDDLQTRLDQAVTQYREGLLSDSVATVDGLLPAARQATAHQGVVIQALTIKGAALVGLLEEEAAKESFRQA